MQFDAQAFAQMFVDAHVDSVTVFAKCHHGMLYYDTDRPERHPHLPRDLNLLEQQIEALHRNGIKAPIYLSVQCDEYAANHYPQWIALNEDKSQVGSKPFTAGWQIMDMSSPYQDYLADQLDEVLRKFAPVDGIFMDMCWDQPSCSRYAIDGMKKQSLDPTNADDRMRYARGVTHQYMDRYSKMLEKAQAQSKPVGVWFNSRPKAHLLEEQKYIKHIEVECLPTGGWGYAYFPYVARLVRNLNLPTLSHTARFHRSWGDFGGIKPTAALMYECCSVLAQGFTNGVGDQMLPDGTLDPEAYRMIGKVYEHIKACEPFVEGAKHVREIAVMVDPTLGDNPGSAGLGFVRMLQELQLQFDIVPTPTHMPINLSDYRMVILPESTPIDAKLVETLQDYLNAGGSLLVSTPAQADQLNKAAMQNWGVNIHGDSPFTTVYLRPDETLSENMPANDPVLYQGGPRFRAANDAQVLCHVVEPYFERAYDHFCSHFQTPPAALSDYAAVIEKGRIITFGFPLFSVYADNASLPLRQLFANAVKRLLPDPMIKADGPSHLEAVVLERENQIVVHLLSFLSSRRAPGLDLIEDAFPLVNMPLAVRLPDKPTRVYLAPQQQNIQWDYRNDYIRIELTMTDGHAIIVIEK
jgi:hypothetical protein